MNWNEKIAVWVVRKIATMTCVYAFTIWALLPLVDPNLQSIVFYVSGGILQLVLLPLIMVGSDIISRNTEVRAAEDHTAIMAELAEIKEIHRILLERSNG